MWAQYGNTLINLDHCKTIFCSNIQEHLNYTIADTTTYFDGSYVEGFVYADTGDDYETLFSIQEPVANESEKEAASKKIKYCLECFINIMASKRALGASDIPVVRCESLGESAKIACEYRQMRTGDFDD